MHSDKAFVAQAPDDVIGLCRFAGASHAVTDEKLEKHPGAQGLVMSDDKERQPWHLGHEKGGSVMAEMSQKQRALEEELGATKKKRKEKRQSGGRGGSGEMRAQTTLCACPTDRSHSSDVSILGEGAATASEVA